MSRRVLYVADPVRPTTAEVDAIEPFVISKGSEEYELDAKILKPHELRVAEARIANLDRAMAWVLWLRRSFPETTFIAPWIASILAGDDDADSAQPEAGLTDDYAVVERCDGIVLCGPRISEWMRREMEHGIENGHRHQGSRIESFAVYDLTPIGVEPWSTKAWRDDKSHVPFHDWYALWRNPR